MLNIDALRRAIYAVSVRHDWEHTTDREDRTEEIAAEYAALIEGTDPASPETNTEAASYIEDDPEAWAFWIDALERYVPELPKLAEHIGEEAGAVQVIGGSILAYLADRRGLYLVRKPTPVAGSTIPPLDTGLLQRALDAHMQDFVEQPESFDNTVLVAENIGRHYARLAGSTEPVTEEGCPCTADDDSPSGVCSACHHREHGAAGCRGYRP